MVAQLPSTLSSLWWIPAGVGIAVLLVLLRGRLGQAVLSGLERVREVCAMLAHKGLHPERLWDGGKDKDAAASASAAALEQSSQLLTGAPLAVVRGEEAEEGKDGEEPEEPAAVLELKAQQEGQGQESAGSEVFMIVTRLLGLIFTLDVLLALLILDGIRTGLVIFEGESGVGLIPLPVSVPTVMGLLGWSMIVLMGSFLMEVVMPRWPIGLEFLPPRWREARASRVLFRALIGLGNIALFCYVVLLGMVAQLKLNHISWTSASVAVATLQMALANLVGLFSLWIVILGIGAAFALVCLVLQVICSLLSLLLKAWVKPVRRATVIGVGAVGVGAVTVRTRSSSELLLPDGGKWKKATTPARTKSGVLEERSLPKVEATSYQSTLVLAGDFGRRSLPDLAQMLPQYGGRRSLRLAGYCPTKRPADASIGKMIRQMGARDISISPRVVALVRQQGGNEIEQLLHQERLKIEQYTPQVAGHELILVGVDWELVHDAVDPLKRLATALPRHVLVLAVEAPAGQLDDPAVQEALDDAAMLRWQKVIACTLLIDRQGPHTQRLVREKQGRFLARSLAGLMVAHQQYEQNPSGAEVFATLGKTAPFITLATGSTALSAGTELSRLDPGSWTRGSARGRGDVEQVRRSLEVLSDGLFADEAACLFPLPLDRERRPLYGEVFIPFPKDRRFREVCEGLEQWTAETVPDAHVVFVAGPGEPDDAVASHYFGQWTWLYGFSLDDVRTQSERKGERTGRTGNNGDAQDPDTKGRGGNGGSGGRGGGGKGRRGPRSPLRGSQGYW